MTAPVSPQGPATVSRPFGPHPGSEPRGNPAARWITVVIGLALLALSGVIARDLWYRSQGDPHNSWLAPVFEFLGSTPINAAAIALGVVLSLLGLWLMVTAFVPRPRTHVAVDSTASIWIRPVDVARKATHTVRAEIGGANVRSQADRKRLTVLAEDDGSGTAQDRASTVLEHEFHRLTRPPSVSVKLAPQTPETPHAAQAPQTRQPAQTPQQPTEVTQ